MSLVDSVKSETVAEHLIGKGVITRADWNRASQVAEAVGRSPFVALARIGLADEQVLATAAAEALELPIGAVSDIEPGVFEDFSPAFLADHHCIPPTDEAASPLFGDPTDRIAVEAMVFASDGDRGTAVAKLTDVQNLVQAAFPQSIEDQPDNPDAAEIERFADDGSDAPTVRTVQRILGDAVRRGASDIHVEPMDRHVAVRLRIDGRLMEVQRLPTVLASPIASRVKVLAGLDISESRLPQDGRIRLTVEGRDIDVRVSTSPIASGESIVLRILSRAQVPLKLDQLGLSVTALSRLETALDRPHGIILVTGPTGSGKSTTLYAAISRLLRPDVKILTVEDPVEMLIEGVNQVQVRPEIDLTYAAALRAFLRQDPDILMIGEVRDHETAEIAMRAALTGHLVLTTLHTNSAAGAFTRLQDIGIEPFLTASTVIASVAQRLIRVLCSDCKSPRPLSDGESALFERFRVTAPAALHEPTGCPACQHVGFKGRMPIVEVIPVDEAVRHDIRAGDTETIAARQAPADTLMGHGLSLAAAGRTSLSEVERAVQLQ